MLWNIHKFLKFKCNNFQQQGFVVYYSCFLLTLYFYKLVIKVDNCNIVTHTFSIIIAAEKLHVIAINRACCCYWSKILSLLGNSRESNFDIHLLMRHNIVLYSNNLNFLQNHNTVEVKGGII